MIGLIYFALVLIFGLVSFHLVAVISGKNSLFTSKSTIIDQMNEMRPLPMGATEFKEWSDRIIAGAMIPCDDPDSLKGALASMLMSLGPTEDHKPDAFFIHALRKAATNEVAHAMWQDIKKKKQAEALADTQEKAPTPA